VGAWKNGPRRYLFLAAHDPGEVGVDREQLLRELLLRKPIHGLQLRRRLRGDALHL
jgi:hypothetical protein